MFQPRPTPGRRAPLLWWAAALATLCILIGCSFAVGSASIGPRESLRAVTDFDPSNTEHLLVHELRIPRTFLAMLVGAGLGLAGALMQSLTRNPLAEPGLLGVNSGAAFTVAIAITLGVIQPAVLMLFAFIGAGISAIAVFMLGQRSTRGNDLSRMVLAGAGLSVMLAAATTILIIGGTSQNQTKYASWATGSPQGRGYDVLPTTLVVILIGAVLALGMSRTLDALALGEDSAKALGISTQRSWVLGLLGIVLLSGAATAAAGPISFIGLAAPHAARMLTGIQHHRLLPLSMALGALALLIADILGRVVVIPDEVGAGAMSALIGAPLFILLARRMLKAGS
ncbi:iron ABC transporter permease [Glutamicibacter halophytocola]|uniref:FecCD family ABC transporter permease n=1 Tax=Glutamicibacter halophytocola TaxID=1933880 RepID=UPI003219DAEC